MGDNTEEVELAIPASTDYARIARLTISGVAARVGFTYDEIDDLRIAVDELVYLLIDRAGEESRLTIVFKVEGSELTVQLRCDHCDGGATPLPSPLSEQILAAIVDEYEAVDDGATVGYRFAKRCPRV